MVEFSLFLLALLNGGWMIFDGFHVIRTGKYFGPEEPGSWSEIVASIGINPLSIGPVFVALGVAWFISIAGLLLSSSWGWMAMLASAIATLWYVKVGTLISIISIALLLIFKASLGYA